MDFYEFVQAVLAIVQIYVMLRDDDRNGPHDD